MRSGLHSRLHATVTPLTPLFDLPNVCTGLLEPASGAHGIVTATLGNSQLIFQAMKCKYMC